MLPGHRAPPQARSVAQVLVRFSVTGLLGGLGAAVADYRGARARLQVHLLPAWPQCPSRGCGFSACRRRSRSCAHPFSGPKAASADAAPTAGAHGRRPDAVLEPGAGRHRCGGGGRRVTRWSPTVKRRPGRRRLRGPSSRESAHDRHTPSRLLPGGLPRTLKAGSPWRISH